MSKQKVVKLFVLLLILFIFCVPQIVDLQILWFSKHVPKINNICLNEINIENETTITNNTRLFSYLLGDSNEHRIGGCLHNPLSSSAVSFTGSPILLY